MEKETQATTRVHFGESRLPDEEDGYATYTRRHRDVSRRSSIGSLSIHSTGGGTRTVQPETALPITYRTLSIEIDEGQYEKQKEVKKAKDKAAVGMSVFDTQHHTYLSIWSSMGRWRTDCDG